MMKDNIFKLLKSANPEDFEIGLSLAYKSYFKEEFETTMRNLLTVSLQNDKREFIFEAYGKTYKRY